jgi:hypothetical protein
MHGTQKCITNGNKTAAGTLVSYMQLETTQRPERQVPANKRARA